MLALVGAGVAVALLVVIGFGIALHQMRGVEV